MQCKHFLIQQLVPPEIYHSRGEGAWELLDTNALLTIDQLYEHFGRMTVNNWHTGGPFKESGFRLAGTTTGAAYSQHKYGRAFDVKPIDIKPQIMYYEILKDPSKFPFLTTLEDIEYTTKTGAGWVHIDCRNTLKSGIKVVKP